MRVLEPAAAKAEWLADEATKARAEATAADEAAEKAAAQQEVIIESFSL